MTNEDIVRLVNSHVDSDVPTSRIAEMLWKEGISVVRLEEAMSGYSSYQREVGRVLNFFESYRRVPESCYGSP